MITLFVQSLAWNTSGQPLAIWSVWGDSDEFGNKSVQCVQLRWKLLEPCGQLLPDSTCEVWERWLLAVWAVRYSECVLAVWPFWLAVCVWEGLNSVCAAELCGERFVFQCTPFRHFLFSCFGLLARDLRHPLLSRFIASPAQAERTCYCVIGSRL